MNKKFKSNIKLIYPVSIPNNNAGASSAILSKYIPTQPIVGITNLKKSTHKNPTII